jgi:uncharacterized membrane protein YeiB
MKESRDIVHIEPIRRKKMLLGFGIIGIFFFGLGLFLIIYSTLGLSLVSESVRPFIIFLFSPIFLIIGLLFIIGVFALSNLKIYKEGISLPERSIKQTLSGKENYLDYNEIEKIVIGEEMYAIFIETKNRGKKAIDKEDFSDLNNIKKILMDIIPDKLELKAN